MDTFLTPEEIKILTGWTSPKKQIEQLRKMGIPFYCNGRGKPIVVRAILDSGKTKTPENTTPKWNPNI